jgi:hypothetical protein
MPTDYVEDNEEVTGQKREDAFPAKVEAKVVVAPEKVEPKKTVAKVKVAPAKVAEVKAVKAK